MNRKIFATLVAVLASLTACGGPVGQLSDLKNLIGSGKTATESRPVANFKSVQVSGSGQLFVERGDTEALTITADDNILPHLGSEVVNGKLTLGKMDVASIQTRTEIIYRLTVKNLDWLGLTGSVVAQVNGLQGATWEVHQDGSTDVTAAGTVNQQQLWLTGSSQYRADGLDSRQATVNATGSSQVLLKVSDRLDVTAQGSSMIEYIGSPAVTRNVNGSSVVKPH